MSLAVRETRRTGGARFAAVSSAPQLLAVEGPARTRCVRRAGDAGVLSRTANFIVDGHDCGSSSLS